MFQFTAGLPKRGGIPSLDGLRALSITFVLIAHLSQTSGFPPLQSAAGVLAGIGVRIFFVISGFLITTLLLKEFDGTGTVDLKRFYFRRTMRIFPAFYAYVIAICWLAMVGFISLPNGLRSVLPALTYTTNYFGDSWVFGHSWSLSIEEQFYLAWPGVFLLRRRRFCLYVAIGVVLFVPVIRVLEFALHVPTPGYRFEFNADALATGCILAIVQEWLTRQSWNGKLRESKWFAINLLAITAFTWFSVDPTAVKSAIYFGALVTLVNIGIALCIDYVVHQPHGWIGSILNSPPLIWAGGLSYSIYIWQELFTDTSLSGVLFTFPANVGAIFGVASASYVLIERPSLRLRTRLERRQGRRTKPDPLAVAGSG